MSRRRSESVRSPYCTRALNQIPVPFVFAFWALSVRKHKLPKRFIHGAEIYDLIGVYNCQYKRIREEKIKFENSFIFICSKNDLNFVKQIVFKIQITKLINQWIKSKQPPLFDTIF